VAPKLIYVMFSQLLGWMMLRTRYDTTKEIEILNHRRDLRHPAPPNPARRHTGAVGGRRRGLRQRDLRQRGELAAERDDVRGVAAIEPPANSADDEIVRLVTTDAHP
jgi:hypothetical protein